MRRKFRVTFTGELNLEWGSNYKEDTGVPYNNSEAQPDLILTNKRIGEAY